MSIGHRGDVETIVSIGANIDAIGGSYGGSPFESVLQAQRLLANWSDGAVRHSSLWASEAVLAPANSPDYINAISVVCAPQGITATEALEFLLDLELKFGRTRSGLLNEPRSMDLDLISFGDLQLQSTCLTLPHPRAAARRFVLLPLAEIDPSYCLPGYSETIASLLKTIENSDQPIRRIASGAMP